MRLTKDKFAASFMIFAAAVTTTRASAKTIQQGSFAMRSGLLQSILAKEMCSCLYVSRLPVADPLLECLRRGNLPLSEKLIDTLLKKRIKEDGQGIEFRSSVWGRLLALRLTSRNQTAAAVYQGPGKGCRLLTDEELAQQRF